MCGWNGVYFSGLPVYEWVSFLHQKYINGVSFSPKKYMNGLNLKNSIWMGSIFKNSIWMGSIFDMGSIWMGHVFHLAWYMNGVGFGDSSRTSVPKIMVSDPPPPRDFPELYCRSWVHRKEYNNEDMGQSCFIPSTYHKSPCCDSRKQAKFSNFVWQY